MNKFKEIQKKLAKDQSLIYLDIETSPTQFYGWGTGDQYVSEKQIVEGTETKIITIQWMFEGDKKPSYLTWDKNHDDTKMLKEFSKVISKAKVAISQNGRSFDHKILRYRLMLNNLTPLKDVEIYDTLTLSRASFKTLSHKLDYRSKMYGQGGKISMDLQDWVNVVNDKPGALEKMIKYGCKDIPDLRAIFWRELPYYTKLPGSLATLVYPEDNKARDYCPLCASKRQRRFDVYPTRIGNKDFMECNNCGHQWKQTRVSSKAA